MITCDHGSENQESNVHLESDNDVLEETAEQSFNIQKNVAPEIAFSKQIVAASILSAEVFVSDENNMKDGRKDVTSEQKQPTRPETESNVFKNTVYRSEALRKAYRGCLQAVQYLSPRNALREERCKTRDSNT